MGQIFCAVQYSLLFQEAVKKRQNMRQSVHVVKCHTLSGYQRSGHTPLWTVNYPHTGPPKTRNCHILPASTTAYIPLYVRFTCFPLPKKTILTNKNETDKINVKSSAEEHLSSWKSIYNVLKWEKEKTKPNYVQLWYHICLKNAIIKC